MRDQKILLVAVLIIACSSGVQSQFNFDDVKNSFSNFGNNVKNWGEGVGDGVSSWSKDAWDKVNKFKDQAMEKFMDKLPDTVKGWIGKGDYRNANVTELIGSMPAKAWNVMKLDQLQSLGKTKFDQLIKEGEGKLPPRILQELKNMQMSNVTQAEAIAELKKQKCKMGERGEGCTVPRPVMMAYISKLGNPADLKKANITAFGKEVVYNLPPPFVKRIKDVEALKQINIYLNDCMKTTSNMCPNKIVVSALMADNNRKIYGKIDMWTKENIVQMGGVTNLSPMQITKLKPTVLKSLKSEVLNAADNFQSTKDRRRILSAIAVADEVNKMDAAGVSTWINSLGVLKPLVLPRDLPAAVRNDATLKTLVTNNAKALAGSGQLDPKTAKSLVKEMLTDISASNMTAAEVDSIGVLLGDANPRLLQRLAKRGVLTGNTLRALGDNFKNNGPGSTARGQALLDTITGTSSVSNVPPRLVQFMSAKQISNMDANSISAFLQIASANPPDMDVTQKSALVNKMASPRENLPPSFKSVIPSASFPTGDMQIKAMAQNMPPTSAASLKASSQMFSKLSNITESDVMQNIPQAFVMSAANAEKVNLADVPKILSILNTGPPPTVNGVPVGPTMDMCRGLKNRMVMAAMKDRDIEDAEQYAQTMTTQDAETTPPCFVAALGDEALDLIDPNVMQIVMQKMGKADNTMSIPRKIRQKIIEAGLMLDEVDVINQDMIFLLGFSVPDLPAEHFEKFDESAKEGFVTSLEMSLKSAMKPCFDQSQRNAIASMIVDVHGEPTTWESLEGRCCILALLSRSQINMIDPDVLASCDCDMDISGLEDYISARESQCMSEVNEDAVDNLKENLEKIEDEQIEAALETLTDLNARRRRKRAAEADACDRASIGGAEVVTVSEIRAMPNDTILDCIYNLGMMEIEDEDKAKVIFDRIKLAKDNKLDTLSLKEMTDMQNIWMGLMESDIKNLPAFAYTTSDDVVLTLGKISDFDMDVCQGLALKVQGEWKAAKDMSAKDLSYVNQLICGFNNTAIDSIPNTVFKEAIVTIKDLEECPDTINQALANKAIAAFGNVANWEASTVNEMGALIGSLKPEELMVIKSDAISGLTVEGLESIPAEAIKAMKVDQIKNLPAATAMALSDDQMNNFNDEMREALRDLFIETGSGVPGIVGSLLLCLMAVGLVQAAA